MGTFANNKFGTFNRKIELSEVHQKLRIIHISTFCFLVLHHLSLFLSEPFEILEMFITAIDILESRTQITPDPGIKIAICAGAVPKRQGVFLIQNKDWLIRLIFFRFLAIKEVFREFCILESNCP